MSLAAYSRRLAAIETLLAPKPLSWPVILFLRLGETIGEAFERHVAKHGPKPKFMQNGLLVVPEMPRTEEEKIAARKLTEQRQAALMELVRQPRTPIPPPNEEGMAQ